MLLRTALLLVLLAANAALAAPRTYQATVTHVTDGDTLWVRPSWGGPTVQIRVQGIDAPEICQAWGPQARQAVEHRWLRRRVTVSERGRDDYGRALARLEGAGQDLGGWLVSSGLAWSYRYQRRPGAYDDQQSQARQARRGLWSDARAMEPRRFRKQHGSCWQGDAR